MKETSRASASPWERVRQLFHAVLLGASLTLAIITGSMEPAQAMDTDIFAATSSSVTAPNVLIILDNTSNWSRQNQHFPGGITQGQAEVHAIKTVLDDLPGHINIGIMEYPTGGRNDTGGFIRFAISPVGSDDGTTGSTNRTNLKAILTTIYDNINDPTEKVNSGQAYGDLMYDAYNYLAGNTPFATSSDVRSDKADSNGYVTNYTKFKSPLSASSSCGTTYIIFIGNPNASGPVADTSANLSALSSLGGDTSQLKLPNYTKTTANLSDNLGYSTACYTTTPTSTTDTTYASCTSQVSSGTYDSCSYSTTDYTSTLSTCSSGSRYSVVQTTPVIGTPTTTTTTTTNSSTTSQCYTSTSSWSANSDTGSLPSCPASSTTTSGGTTTSTSYSCSYSISSSGSTSCGSSTTSTTGTVVTTTAESTSCYSNTNSWNSNTDKGTLTCPSSTTSTSGGVTTTTTYACTYSGDATGSTTGCGNNKQHITITQSATPTTTVTGTRYKFPITQTVTKTVQTGTQTGTTSTTLGNTYSCYASQAACSTSDYTCASGSTCACSTPTTTTGSCPSGSSRYQVLGNYTQTITAATGTYSTDTGTYNADEWARFLHLIGVPVGTTKQTVMTYTIDVYNLQPDTQQSGLLSSMARNGGGKYFTATNEAAIISALQTIFAEIQAVNNTFASAALPISATNRAQNSNQVYIGMFRPDQGDHPRWFGNLKRYQVATIGGFSGLAGQDGNAAVSNTTGFVTPCGISYWTTASTNYWYDSTRTPAGIVITQAKSGYSGTAWDTAGDDSNYAKGTCDSSTQWSDYPDGPTVEKGGAAQQLRNNFSSGRTLYTTTTSTSSGALLTFSTSTTGLSTDSTVNTNIAKFIMGQDVTGEIGLTPSTAARPSIHGDVIHSRPLPVDHGGSTGVVIYYGAGDGVYRAVQGSTGKELWGFVAPESYSYLQRLMDNTPLVLTPNPTPPSETAVSGTTGRDFFFDGSTGVYQNSDNTKVWIFPAMRRGGRMLYAFDVTVPTAPTLKWRVGCPSLSSDTGCTTGMSAIGQTWSTPQVAKVNGYKSGGVNKPVIIVGGGYDTCEDSDSASPSCSGAKGAIVYVLDAENGTVLNSFTTTAAASADASGPTLGRSVAADVTLVDTNGDGIVDYAYAADTGGSIYRIDFPSAATSESEWTMKRVAYTNITSSDSHRKFLFAPGVLPYKGSVYVAIVSGDREHPLALSYPYTTPVKNRAYVYLDDPSRSASTDLDGPKMKDQTVNPSCGTDQVLPGTTYYGWYMDLKAGTGEQGVTSALIFGGMVTFSTNRPTGAAETCSTSLGEARGYFVNLLNGSGAIGVSGTCGGTVSSVFPGGGLPPSAVAATVSVNGTEQTILIGAPCKDGTSCAPIQAQQLSPPIASNRTRTYWKVNTDNK